MIVSREKTQRLPRSTSSPIPGQSEDSDSTGRIERETIRLNPGSARATQSRRIRALAPVVARASKFGTGVRVLFGGIWLVDAYFKWQPSFHNGMLNIMHDATTGQPAWLTPWFRLNRSILALQPSLSAYGIALLETGIALALIFGIARKVTYVTGAVWTMLIWSTAEGFGRSRPGDIATDIGTGIIYTVVFLALLALDRYEGTRRFSVDAALERHLPWWRRIAEVRR